NGDCVTPTRIAIGDAAIAIDPISSSGVQKAIQTALSGAIVVNTLLRRPESTEPALSFYIAQLAAASERHRRWAAGHYGEVALGNDHRFWRDGATAVDAAAPSPVRTVNSRALLTTPVELSHELKFVRTPCLQGDFVRVASALQHPALGGPVVFLSG